MQASCVSHDMRAPLGAISYMVNEVVNKKGTDKKIIKLLKPVLCASNILNVQVNNLLDYNLFKKKKFRLNAQKVEIK